MGATTAVPNLSSKGCRQSQRVRHAGNSGVRLRISKMISNFQLPAPKLTIRLALSVKTQES